MRIFLDTNVLVSAVATRGLCADVLREILTRHQLIISDPLVKGASPPSRTAKQTISKDTHRIGFLLFQVVDFIPS